jgi:hypothetical protein
MNSQRPFPIILLGRETGLYLFNNFSNAFITGLSRLDIPTRTSAGSKGHTAHNGISSFIFRGLENIRLISFLKSPLECRKNNLQFAEKLVLYRLLKKGQIQGAPEILRSESYIEVRRNDER